MRKLIVLGSTGSIGTQALDIAGLYPEDVQVTALSAHSSAEALFEQVRKFKPQAAALTMAKCDIPEDLMFCQWYFGENALHDLVRDIPCDDVLVAVVGMASLRAVITARNLGRRILFANKETLVAGGHLIMPLCSVFSEDPTLIPVDSEHSAIYQCLQNGTEDIRRLILTASGGPFRTKTINQMEAATVAETLKHPNWQMGAKITVDSATMFNKALEIIEAKWLFNMEPEQIDVVIHPQSIVHSFVEFQDGALLAQLGTHDMHLPIMYAMLYPRRKHTPYERLDLEKLSTLTFEKPDIQKFPSLKMAYDAMRMGVCAPCVLNAANEIAVAHFLRGEIRLTQIYEIVAETLNQHSSLAGNTVEDILFADLTARQAAEAYIRKI